MKEILEGVALIGCIGASVLIISAVNWLTDKMEDATEKRRKGKQ